jgi:hypothetical protein
MKNIAKIWQTHRPVKPKKKPETENFARVFEVGDGIFVCRSRVSSGRIVSDYGLDDRAIEVRSPVGAKEFFPLASVSRPALVPTQPPVQWVPVVLSPGVKHGRGVTLTTHPHLIPRSRMSRSYTPLPPSASMACSGTALPLLLIFVCMFFLNANPLLDEV